MRIPYTFTVLRYVHDVVSGEFVNVGVLVYAPRVTFLRIKCDRHYGRLAAFFGKVDHHHFKRVIAQVESRSRMVELGAFGHLKMFQATPSDVVVVARAIVPPDDSSLQFSAAGSGLAKDIEKTLETLYDRYVQRYSERPPTGTRLDGDVLRAFEDQLRMKGVLGKVKAETVVSPLYEHEFPHAWHNGKLNTAEAVSFDMAYSKDIVKKANTWLGRGVNLAKSAQAFKLHLVIGKPSRPNQAEAFHKAMGILREIPPKLYLEIVDESQSAALADKIAKEIKAHEAGH
jgi:hypothetical protein